MIAQLKTDNSQLVALQAMQDEIAQLRAENRALKGLVEPVPEVVS